jgi:hypothetical protein
VIALREWSRLAEELQQERTRLSNRIRQQLWRYDPQLLAVSDDVTAEWVLELWTLAPTPAKVCGFPHSAFRLASSRCTRWREGERGAAEALTDRSDLAGRLGSAGEYSPRR